MSILERLKKQERGKGQKGVFAIIKGIRTAGKSTLAGTLPGKTLLIQASLKETSDAAVVLAKKNKNDLTVFDLTKVEEFKGVVAEFAESEYDNLFIDGLTALTNIKYNEPRVNRLVNGVKDQIWTGFREIGDTMDSLIESCKSITNSTTKNIFITLALDPKTNAEGEIVDVNPVLKGNATLGSLEGYGNNLVTITAEKGESGLTRKLLTADKGAYSSRLGSVLDEDNPGFIEADLGKLISLINNK